MAKFTRFYKEMIIEGDFPVKITMEAINPDPEFVILQEKAELEGQLDILDQQLNCNE